MKWELGTIRLSRRITLEVQIECGGELTPTELRDMGLLLQGIAAATRKWQASRRIEQALAESLDAIAAEDEAKRA